MTQTAPQSPAQSAATSTFDERLLDLKLEAVEARTETKFAQLIGKLDQVVDRISDLRAQVGALDTKIQEVDTHAKGAKTTIFATGIGAAIGIVGLAYAAVTIFQAGMSTTASAYGSGMAAAEARKK